MLPRGKRLIEKELLREKGVELVLPVLTEQSDSPWGIHRGQADDG